MVKGKDNVVADFLSQLQSLNNLLTFSSFDNPLPPIFMMTPNSPHIPPPILKTPDVPPEAFPFH